VISAVVRSSTSPGISIPGSEIEKLKTAAATLLHNCGFEYGPNKIARLVLTFAHRVERNGFSFIDFLANSVRLSAEDRRRALADPELAELLKYWEDPTGFDAVRNVTRERGH